jgi:hypothetical protein
MSQSTKGSDAFRTIRVLPFSGKEEDWNRWSETFLFMATSRVYWEVLKPTNEKMLADSDKNINTYNNLMLACQDYVTFRIIEESVSINFPDGDSRLAWKNLFNKFEPTTGSMKVQFKSKFQKMKIVDPDEDPHPWMNKIELIRKRLQIIKSNIDKEDLTLQILNNLPREYEPVIEFCEE